MARLRRGVGGTLVLDAEGLTKLSNGDTRAVSRVKLAHARNAAVVTAATTLTEVLRGGRRDAPVYRALNKIKIVSIHAGDARVAGELLGRIGLSGHQYVLDALLAVVALAQPRPVVLLTSDTEDMERMTEEPGRPRSERVAVVRI
jgi:predicted nucleic acid-binding protein